MLPAVAARSYKTDHREEVYAVFIELHAKRRAYSYMSTLTTPGSRTSRMLFAARFSSAELATLAHGCWRSIVYLTKNREISKKHPLSPRSWGGKRAHVTVSSSFSMQLDKNCINLLAMVGLVASRRRGA